MAGRTPSFTVEQAREMAGEVYGFEATTVTGLPSYYDQNFLLADARGCRVLKIANSADDREILQFQNRTIEQVDRAVRTFEVPRVFQSLAGECVALAPAGGRRHGVRLLSYVKGQTWSQLSSHSESLLRSLGRTVGDLSHALNGFSHPAMRRFREWDLKNALRLRDLLGAIADAEQRAMIERILIYFETSLAPRLGELPTGVIHGDVNNDNVLVSGDEVVGVIDFGDAVLSARVFEVAIAIGYAMLGSDDSAVTAQHVLDGCLEVLALQPDEIAVVFDLARIRIAMSVTYAAHYGALDPDNTYLSTNVERGWQVLEQLDGKDLRAELIATLRRRAKKASCRFRQSSARLQVMEFANQLDRRYTWDDYRAWDDGQRWELIAGRPFCMSPARSSRHQAVVTDLSGLLSAHFQGKPCRPFVAPTDVRLSAKDVVQPDILVVCDRTQIRETHIEGPPTLAIEILSPSSHRHDRVRKLRLYARFGIQEYWIVQPNPAVVEVLQLTGEIYSVAGVYTDVDTLRSPTFPDLALELGAIFSLPLPVEEQIDEIRESAPPYAVGA